jgi:methylisocitrate lyase
MNSPSAGTQFRKILSHGTVTLPGVYNAITAKLARQAGFDALYLSGAGVTNATTGYPDIALLTLTEMAEQAHYVARAVDVPVIADADTGYGEVHNVMRAVEELENAGLAGIHLEDQVAPKRCGHLDGKQVIPAVEMARKIRAAVRAKSDKDFYLIARTDARGVEGLDHAIDRAKRYLDAGADAIFPESLQHLDEFAKFAEAVKAPLLANMTEFGKTPLIPAADFAAMGYAMVIFPMTAFRVMMRAAEELYRELKSAGTQSAFINRMQTRKELYELIRYSDYEDLDRRLAEEETD